MPGHRLGNRGNSFPNSKGIKGVDRVLFTHHHREQLQGAGLINRSTTDVWAPEKERDFFEQPASFRKWWPKLGDKFRPVTFVLPLTPLLLTARSVMGSPLTGKASAWRISTPGHSPGHMAYLLERDGKTIASRAADGAKFSTWFDSEWDYGKGSALLQSTEKLNSHKPTIALPSHGPPIERATRQLETFKENSRGFGQATYAAIRSTK